MSNWQPDADIGNIPFIFDVARGKVPGVTYERKFGSIDAVQVAVPADVWQYGATVGAEEYTWSADGVADIDRVSSSSAADVDNVIITGLDIDGYEVTQTVKLEGQTPVALPTPLWRVNRVENGNGADYQGNIYVFVDSAVTLGVPDIVTNVRGYIKLGDNQTLQSMYTSPRGKRAYLMSTEVSISKSGGATAVACNFKGYIRLFGGVFKVKDQYDLLSSGTSRHSNYNAVWGPFPGRSDFKPYVEVSANGVGASWAFTVLLVND